MDSERKEGIGVSDTDLVFGPICVSRTKFSHLCNSGDEFQSNVTLRIYQICEQMKCYPVYRSP